MSALPNASKLIRRLVPWVWVPSSLLLLPIFMLSVAIGIFVFKVLRIPLVSDSILFDSFGLAIAIIIGFVSFQATLLFVLPVHLAIFGIRNREGEMSLGNPRLAIWYHITLTTYLCKIIGAPMIYSTGYGRFLFRLLGAKIGDGSFINTVHLLDCDLIRIGRNVLLGGECWIMCHSAEQGKLIRKPVTIGDDSSVGLKAVILPGAKLGRNCHVGAMSLVPKDAVLDDDAVYGGVPVRKIKDLTPNRS